MFQTLSKLLSSALFLWLIRLFSTLCVCVEMDSDSKTLIVGHKVLFLTVVETKNHRMVNVFC